MIWIYKIVSYPDEDNTRYYQLHEAYYDDSGKLIGISESPASIGGNSVHELREVVNMMVKAVKSGSPVITIEEIEEMEKGA